MLVVSYFYFNFLPLAPSSCFLTSLKFLLLLFLDPLAASAAAPIYDTILLLDYNFSMTLSLISVYPSSSSPCAYDISSLRCFFFFFFFLEVADGKSLLFSPSPFFSFWRSLDLAEQEKLRHTHSLTHSLCSSSSSSSSFPTSDRLPSLRERRSKRKKRKKEREREFLLLLLLFLLLILPLISASYRYSIVCSWLQKSWR